MPPAHSRAASAVWNGDLDRAEAQFAIQGVIDSFHRISFDVPIPLKLAPGLSEFHPITSLTHFL